MTDAPSEDEGAVAELVLRGEELATRKPVDERTASPSTEVPRFQNHPYSSRPGFRVPDGIPPGQLHGCELR